MSADVFEYPVVLVRPAVAKETRVILYHCTLSTHTAPVFTDNPMTMVRLLVDLGPRASKHFRRQKTCRRRVADECVPTYTSRQGSSATICPRQLVFNIKHG